MDASQYSPGSLIRARNREWMVVSSVDKETLRVRPITGSEEDQTLINLPLEIDPVSPATFPHPQKEQVASHEGALLLRDSLVLSLRRGAGPFRSLGHISVEPRAYQLVPLLMALKQDVVRLLIADDVGIGKTIEAGLIARELMDRGDIERMVVLCPPHLVEQWTSELEGRFHIQATAVTAASASRLERGLPPNESIFTSHPYTVVSLDYIKSEKRRSDFLRACPEFVIVDEAHTCSAAGRGHQLRYELLKQLAENKNRHMVLLTATPHSGDEGAFFNLLGLLDKQFSDLQGLTGEHREKLRAKLANHFVQRRRPDIDEWREDTKLFPKRETVELTYKLTGEWDAFQTKIRRYCAEIVESSGTNERKQRLNFWGTLALLRCASSSPAAAVKALRTRAQRQDIEDSEFEQLVFDGGDDDLPSDDVEIGVEIEDKKLKDLIDQAMRLAGQEGDPKLKLLTAHLDELLEENYSPVVFCRFIATAHYLKEHLVKKFKGVSIEVITGELTSSERKQRIEEIDTQKKRLLIATDCLSEGINLQDHFDAVVHYDLSWNPTRHEQREGRVDRFGQKRETVRASLIYGENNPVDGAVLTVIIRKAESIRRELGVPVPLPDDQHKLTQALMKAVLLKDKGSPQRPKDQLTFEIFETDEAKELMTVWEDAAASAKKNQTIFAQRRLKPSEVLPEWKKAIDAIGSQDDVKRFTQRALARLGSATERLRNGYRAPLSGLSQELQSKLENDGFVGDVLVDFKYPAETGCRPILRSSPLVHTLADSLLEKTLQATDETPGSEVLGRCGCWISSSVDVKTTVLLVRLRHQLITLPGKGSKPRSLLVEEALTLGWGGKSLDSFLEEKRAFDLLTEPPKGDPPKNVKERIIEQALQELSAKSNLLNEFANQRAQELLEDHRRVKEASRASGGYEVSALLPPDVIGVYVLLPQAGN